jgi:hypothetical protein
VGTGIAAIIALHQHDFALFFRREAAIHATKIVLSHLTGKLLLEEVQALSGC